MGRDDIQGKHNLVIHDGKDPELVWGLVIRHGNLVFTKIHLASVGIMYAVDIIKPFEKHLNPAVTLHKPTDIVNNLN